MRLNRPVTGFMIGLVAPLLGFIVVFFALGHGVSLSAFMDHLAANHNNAATILSLCLIANGICLVLISNRRLDYALRGLFTATMLYAVLYILLKFVW